MVREFVVVVALLRRKIVIVFFIIEVFWKTCKMCIITIRAWTNMQPLNFLILVLFKICFWLKLVNVSIIILDRKTVWLSATIKITSC